MQGRGKPESLSVTLTMSFLISILLVLFISSSLWLYLNSRVQGKLVSDQQNLIAQMAASTVSSFIQERSGLLKSTASLSRLASAPKEEQRIELARLLGLEPSFRQLVLLDAKEQEINRVSRLSQAASGRLTEQLGNGIVDLTEKEGVYIGQVYIDDITSEPMVIIAVAVTDILGDFQGILLSEVNLKSMWDMVTGIKIGKRGLAYVVDNKGDLIAFMDISRVLARENLVRLNEVAEFVKLPSSKHTYNLEISRGINGNYVVSTHVHLGNPDWAVMVELPLSEAYQPVIQGAVSASGVFILGVVMAVLLGVYLSRSIAGPIIKLRNATFRIGAGELDTEIKIDRNDEIGDLAKAFNMMTRDLRRTTTSIDSLNAEIADRKRIESELWMNRERYQALLDNSFFGIAVVGTDYRIIMVNAAFARLFNKPAGDFVGKYCYNEFEKRNEICLHCPGRQAMVSLKTEEVETQGIRDDGIRFWVHNRAVPFFGENGKLQGFIEMVEDIDARKRGEIELKAAYEQLKAAQAQLVQSAKMASVGLLAGGVAHEINNPLTGVLNNVQLIKMIAEQKKEFKIEDYKELLDLIEESAQRCTRITRSLLGFSRASRGIEQILDMNEMVEKVAILIEHELRLQNISIETKLASDLPRMKGDTQLIQQIIFDIITNAKWAIQKKNDKEGGAIRIKTGYAPDENRLYLAISDNGIGIAAENLEHIFEPFFTTKPVGEGTGLGLSIVYNIIRQHNGAITVESALNQGATFKISFPAVKLE